MLGLGLVLGFRSQAASLAQLRRRRTRTLSLSLILSLSLSLTQIQTLVRHSYEDIITAAGVTGAAGSAEDRYKIRRGAMLDC